MIGAKEIHFGAKRGFVEGLLGVNFRKKYADSTVGEMIPYLKGYDVAGFCKIAAYGAGLTLLGMYLRHSMKL